MRSFRFGVVFLLVAGAALPAQAISRKRLKHMRDDAFDSSVPSTRGYNERHGKNKERILPILGSGKGGKGRAGSYIGCLGLNEENIDSQWTFQGTPKSCSYTHHAGKGGKGGKGSNGYNDDDESGSGDGGSGDDQADGKGKNAGEEDYYDQDVVVDETDFENTDDYTDDNGNNQGDDGNGQNDDGVTQAYDPYYDFDIETCDTYENLWLWDLSLTCDSAENLVNCECTFAEELIELGLLSCSDATLCPNECSICSTCMQLIGCTFVTSGISSERTSNTLYVLAAGIGLLVFGMIYFVARRRRNDSDLSAHLMEDEQLEEPSPVVPPPPVEEEEPRVWLAPDMPPAQFEPSAEAAARSSEDPMQPMSILSSSPTFAPPADDQVWLAPVT